MDLLKNWRSFVRVPEGSFHENLWFSLNKGLHLRPGDIWRCEKLQTLEPDLRSWGYTMFHAVSKMGATLSACFSGVWKILKRCRSHWRFQGDFASWGMPFDRSQHVLNPADSHNFRVSESPNMTTCSLCVVVTCHETRDSTNSDPVGCSYQSLIVAPGPWGFAINQVRLRWISVQSEDLHCALKWELQRIGVALALIWA